MSQKAARETGHTFFSPPATMNIAPYSPVIMPLVGIVKLKARTGPEYNINAHLNA